MPPPDPSELAKAWLVALIEAGTLEDAAHIDTAAFARDAPGYCAALLAALAEDVALPPPPADPAPLREAALGAVDARLAELTGGGAVARGAAAAEPPTPAAILAGLAEPFVLLAAEATWRHGDHDAAAARLAQQLRPGDQLLAAGPGRWWLVLPGTEAGTARALAADLGDDGTFAFGLAACPHDGADPEALMAHADEMLFSARAAGVPVR
ncbi:MAG TPA: hypothetical protein VFZ89_18170 [Solirubrobacteraceae bacterium]